VVVPGQLPWGFRCRIAADVAAGMEYLHALGHAHLDLKSLNVLIKDEAAKLTDFGSTRRFHDFVSSGGGESGSDASGGAPSAAAPQSCAGTPEWQVCTHNTNIMMRTDDAMAGNVGLYYQSVWITNALIFNT
jgi:serine/threonine protein kinase